MAIQRFQAIKSHSLERKHGLYPPGSGLAFTRDAGVARSFSGGIFYNIVNAIQFAIMLPTDGRITGAQFGFTGLSEKTNANARDLCADYYPWDGSTNVDFYTDASPNGALQTALAPLANNAPVALAGAGQNIPLNGNLGLRLTISGGQPAGKNELLFAVGAAGFFIDIEFTRNRQPVITEPQSGGYDATIPFTLRWRHEDGSGLRQGRYKLQYSVNGGAFQVIDINSPNEFHTFAGNFFAPGSNVVFKVQTASLGETNILSVESAPLAVFMGNFVPPPTAVTPAGQIGQSQPALTWASALATRVAWQARILRPPYNDSDVVPFTDSGERRGQALIWNQPIVLEDAAAFRAQARQKSAQEIWSAWASSNFNTVFVPPPAPIVVANPEHALGRTVLAITNPAPGGGEDNASFNRIKRSVDGGLTYELLKAVWPINEPYLDYTAPSKINSLYIVEAVGVAGGGKPSNPAAALLNLRAGFWIHDIYDPENSILNIEAYRGGMGGEWLYDVEYMQFEGGRRAAYEDDEQEVDTFDAQFVILTVVTNFFPVNKWPLYEALIKRRSVYCVRPFSGKAYIGKITSIPQDIVDSSGVMHGYTVSLHLEGLTGFQESKI